MLRAVAAVFVVVVGSCADEGAVVAVDVDVVAVVGDVDVGRDLFAHPWSQQDERSHGGDGLGPDEHAASCVACHNAGGLGGAGATNVETASGAPRNTPALFGAGLIDAIPDDVIEENALRKGGERSDVDAAANVGVAAVFGFGGPNHALGGRVGRTAEGFVTRFGWKGDVRDLPTFVTQACAHELGLEVPGAHQPPPPFRLDSIDPDSPLARALGGIRGVRGHVNAHGVVVIDGVAPDVVTVPVAPVVVAAVADPGPGLDLDLRELVSLTSFAAALPRPVEVNGGRVADVGRTIFDAIGCSDCHQRRLGDVDGLYSDLLLHDMGRTLSDPGGYYGNPAVADAANLWRTPPLWGVAVSGPWMHDGRAERLDDAIRLHDGEGVASRRAFAALAAEERAAVLAFLNTLQPPSSLAPPSI